MSPRAAAAAPAVGAGDQACRSIVLAGAAPDTSNLGVSALCFAVLAGLRRALPDAAAVVLDHGRGVRSASVGTPSGEIGYRRIGAHHTRRLYRPESLWRVRVSSRLGGLGNPAAKAVRSAAALLDISGGDSFTDLYGRRRLEAVSLPKLIAIEAGTPLVLLPQTYGPFGTVKARRLAERIVRAASMAWARDERSFVILRELLGDDFDAARHRCGVDVAFALEPAGPPASASAGFLRWLEDDARPLVGVNISGLIWNDPDGGRARFGFRADYRRAMLGFLRRLLGESECRLLIVPHVLTAPGHYESDPGASAEVLALLGREFPGDRVAVAPGQYGPHEAKWMIARCDWFCGTRMHATIAGLSSGVPTAAVAYSDKTLGVFQSCGQGEHVADPRRQGTEELAGRLWHSWTERRETAATLAAELPAVTGGAVRQMEEIAAVFGREPTRSGAVVRG